MINDYPKPKLCPYRISDTDKRKDQSNITVEYYPLSFGFNEHYLFNAIKKKVWINQQEYTINQTCIPIKSIDFSSLIPGRRETYRFTFGNELDYRRMYSAAFFAITMKKAGWDCNRHYEILSSGTVPYFDHLEDAGFSTMIHLPKTLLLEARTMDGVNRTNLTIDHQKFNLTQYRLLLHRLIYYSKHRLTTRKLVEYILRTINYPMNYDHSVLFMTHAGIDYTKEFMLHGFTFIFGRNLYVYGVSSHLYTYPRNLSWTKADTTQHYKKPLYGFGFGYALSLRKYAGF